MANYLINSAAVAVTGTDNDDTFQIVTGASAVTVDALAADDTITLSADGETLTDSFFYLREGNDTVEAVGVGLSNVFIGGSEGDDTITIGDDAFNGVTVNGGQGADTINFSIDVDGTASSFSIQGGRGNDEIFLNSAGNNNSFATGFIGAGKGRDLIAISAGLTNFDAVSIAAGLGEDVIEVSAGVISNSVINGGGNGTDIDTDSADVFGIFADTFADTEILGNGGGDVIGVFAGSEASSLSVGGNMGADDIFFESNFETTGVTLGGGKGDDTIVFAGDTGDNSANLLIGGDGNDTLTVDLGNDVEDGFIYQGGAGADTINTFGGELVGADFNYTAFSDSTLTTLDQISVGGAEATAGLVSYAFFTQAGVGIVDNGIITGVAGDVNVSAGIIVSMSAGGYTTLTAAVEFLDTEVDTNDAVFFKLDAADSGGYLFIQGGDTDLVVQMDGFAANAFESGGAVGSAGSLAAVGIAGATRLDLIG